MTQKINNALYFVILMATFFSLNKLFMGNFGMLSLNQTKWYGIEQNRMVQKKGFCTAP